MAHATAHFFGSPPPGALGRGQKVKYHLISITSQFQRFLNQTLCVFSQLKDIKKIQMGFSFRHLGHAPGVGLGGTVGGQGVQKLFFCKFNQIWCVSYLHEWYMQRHNFLGPSLLGPWGWAKTSNIIKSQLQSQFQRFSI